MTIKSVKKVENQPLAFLQVTIVLIGTPTFFFLDSPWASHFFPYGQDLDNAIMIVIYSWILLGAKYKLYWLILLMTICGLGAEIFGSLVLKLYQYRLGNIPLYIPLGHALIYTSVYHLCNNSRIWPHHRNIEQCLAKSAFVISFLSLFFLHDVAGFLGYLLFVIILPSRKKHLFYLSMFVVVYYIGLCGTIFSTWQWYGVRGNHPHFPPIGYTPAGEGGLYLLIDLVSNSIYYYTTRLKKYFTKLTNSLQRIQTE